MQGTSRLLTLTDVDIVSVGGTTKKSNVCFSKRVWGKVKSRRHKKVPCSCLCHYRNTPIGSHTCLCASQTQWSKATVNSWASFPWLKLTLSHFHQLTAWTRRYLGVSVFSRRVVCVWEWEREREMGFTVDVGLEFEGNMSGQQSKVRSPGSCLNLSPSIF